LTTADKIFISHASTDRGLADLLRDTLLLGGIPGDRIFYSSSRATGITSGTDVRAHLRSELQQAGLIIELISTIFLTRPICLLELGGAWALEKPTYPIVVPPLTYNQAAAVIGEVHMGELGSHDEIDGVFDELHDRLAYDVGLSTAATAWNPVARRFKNGLPTVLAGLAAATAPPATTPTTPPPTSPSRPTAEHSAAATLEVTVPEGFDVQRPNRLRVFRTWLSNPLETGSTPSSKKYPIEGQVAPLLPGGAVAIAIRTDKWYEQGTFPLRQDGSFSGHVYLHDSLPRASLRFRILGADDSIFNEYVVQVT
jgi:hypothetical protein